MRVLAFSSLMLILATMQAFPLSAGSVDSLFSMETTSAVWHVKMTSGNDIYSTTHEILDESIILLRWSLTPDGPWHDTEMRLLLSDIAKIDTAVSQGLQSDGTHINMHSGWIWGSIMGLAMIAMMLGGMLW